MSKKQPTPTLKTLTDDVAELGRDMWLAGLGAIATVEEESKRLYDTLLERREQLGQDSRKRLEEMQKEANKLFDDLVARGEKFEARGRKQLTARVDAAKDEVTGVRKDLAERQKKMTGRVEKATEKVEKTLSGTVEAVFERLEVPTRTEVKDLAAKVDGLAGRVNALTALLTEKAPKATKAPAAVFHVVPHEEDWAVKQEGIEKPLKVLGTKAEVLAYARELAKKKEPSRLVIHRQDGTIQDQVVYAV